MDNTENDLTVLNTPLAVETCFTPGQNCVDKLTAQLMQAQSSILVEAYQFTSQPIADALVAAQNRGVSVQVILDKSQVKSKYSMLSFLHQSGVPVWIDTKPTIAHNKIMIIDQREVITGSFNFTDSAQKHNAENILFISNEKVAQDYLRNWECRKTQSKSWPYPLFQKNGFLF